jgi:uncharacterized membrane protein
MIIVIIFIFINVRGSNVMLVFITFEVISLCDEMQS